MNENRPLLNIGDVLASALDNKLSEIPTLETKSHTVGATKDSQIVKGERTTNFHKIVFVLAREKRTMHRQEIYNRIQESPESTLSVSLGILTDSGILVKPEWGYYTLHQNFLGRFQLKFGGYKFEILQKMFDEGGIDTSSFQFEREHRSDIEEENTLSDVLASLSKLKEKRREQLATATNRLTQLETEVETVKAQKSNIETELAKLETLNLAV
jgi:hypothetical protein